MAGPLCVIFNPASGRNRAGRRLEQLGELWPGEVEFLPTERPGHAMELAERAAESGRFESVAAAGGDGTAHEVANGLLRAAGPEVSLLVIPLGSANDYAWSLQQQFSHASSRGSGENSIGPHAVDVGLVEDGHGRKCYFICNVGIGLNAAVTAESKRIGWLQGLPLYGLAAARALMRQAEIPTWTVIRDDQPPVTGPGMASSLLLGQREGNFHMAPRARLDDGWFDHVHARKLSRLQALWTTFRIALSEPPTDHPEIEVGRCRSLQLTSDAPLCIHTDGELFCVPDDQVRQVKFSLLPLRLKVDVLNLKPAGK